MVCGAKQLGVMSQKVTLTMYMRRGCAGGLVNGDSLPIDSNALTMRYNYRSSFETGFRKGATFRSFAPVEGRVVL
jgi:hypothetical protein